MPTIAELLKKAAESSPPQKQRLLEQLEMVKAERDLARERGYEMADVNERLCEVIRAMREAIKMAWRIIEPYSDSSRSNGHLPMCPECHRVAAWDEEHKEDCVIGNALAALQPFIPTNCGQSAKTQNNKNYFDRPGFDADISPHNDAARIRSKLQPFVKP